MNERNWPNWKRRRRHRHHRRCCCRRRYRQRRRGAVLLLFCRSRGGGEGGGSKDRGDRAGGFSSDGFGAFASYRLPVTSGLPSRQERDSTGLFRARSLTTPVRGFFSFLPSSLPHPWSEAALLSRLVDSAVVYFLIFFMRVYFCSLWSSLRSSCLMKNPAIQRSVDFYRSEWLLDSVLLNATKRSCIRLNRQIWNWIQHWRYRIVSICPVGTLRMNWRSWRPPGSAKSGNSDDQTSASLSGLDPADPVQHHCIHAGCGWPTCSSSYVSLIIPPPFRPSSASVRQFFRIQSTIPFSTFPFHQSIH